MPPSRYEVRISDGIRDYGFRLASDDKGHPLFHVETLSLERLIRPATQLGEADYANFLPGIGGVYSQPDLSGGIGKKYAVKASHDQANHYYYSKWLDAGIPGQIQKGGLVTQLVSPANAGTLTGGFVLANVPYPVLGRVVSKWDATTDTLSSSKDLGSGASGAGAALFVKLAAEALLEDGTAATGGSDTLKAADDRLAQQVRSGNTAGRYLSRVDVKLQGTGSLTGDIRLQVQADLNGRPSMQVLTSSTISGITIATGAAAVYTFRFDDDDSYYMAPNEPFWLVLDLAFGSAANYVTWTKSTSDVYSRGVASKSTDRGNSWTNDASSYDFYFGAYAKTPTETVFLADTATGNKFQSSTDGATFTADTYRSADQFATLADRIVRTVQGTGAVQWSTDGTNWGEPTPVGDPSVPIVKLLANATALIVVKQDSIWGMDFVATSTTAITPDIQQVYSGGSQDGLSAKGACVWRGAAYVPFGQQLLGIEGSLDGGFTVHTAIGPENSTTEWDSPLGAGDYVAAVVGGRHWLYAISNCAGATEVFKSAAPLKKEWHGSIFGSSGAPATYAFIYDPGITGDAAGLPNPELFFQAGANVQRVRLARTANPAADPNFLFDTANVGQLFYPEAHGNFQINPKSWSNEAITFATATAGDFAEWLYDNHDGDGYRRMPDPGRLYDTGILFYPDGLASRLLARQLRISNQAQTASPRILACGCSYAVRPARDIREITFTIRAETGQSVQALGDVLGQKADSMESYLYGATVTGTRTLTDPSGNLYRDLLVRVVKATTITLTDEKVDAVEVNAVGEFMGKVG